MPSILSAEQEFKEIVEHEASKEKWTRPIPTHDLIVCTVQNPAVGQNSKRARR